MISILILKTFNCFRIICEHCGILRPRNINCECQNTVYQEHLIYEQEE